MLTLVGRPISKAQKSLESDLSDDQMMPIGIDGPAAQEPTMRITFRDPAGQVQQTTVLSTYRFLLGSDPSEARKQRLWQVTAQWYRLMGCDLLNLEMITTQPFSI